MEGRFAYFTKTHLILELLCLIGAVFFIVFFFLQWSAISGPIPTHFNATGQADAWGDKTCLLFELLAAFGLYLILSVVELFPKTWNMPVKVTEENRGRLINIALYLLIIIKLLVVLLFFTIIFFSMQAAPLPVWLIPDYLIILFSIIAVFIVKLVRARSQSLQ
jgi:hypothetical protein